MTTERSIGIRARRTVMAALAATLIGAAFTPGPVSAQTTSGPDGCGSLVPAPLQGWLVPTPRYPEGGPSTVTYAVDPWQTKTLLVTNGTVVMKSTDGGCSWRQVFSLSDVAPDDPTLTGGNGVIAAIVTAGRPRANYYLVVNNRQDARTLGKPQIYRSSDGGSSWEHADDGLPIQAIASHLVFAPSDPNKAYLVLDNRAFGVGVAGISFYYTSDAGSTWEAVTQPTETLPTSDEMEASVMVRDLAVSPTDPQELWTTTTLGVFKSDDGGDNWELQSSLPDTVDVIHLSGSGDTITVFSGDSKDLRNFQSDDGGRTWRLFFTPDLAHGVGDGPAPGELVGSFGSDGTRAFLYTDSAWVILTDFGGGSYVDIQRDFTSQPRFYLMSERSLWMYQPIDLATARSNRLSPNALSGCGLLQKVLPQSEIPVGRLDAPSMLPRDEKLVLDPGQVKLVDYAVRVPRIPLDLAIALDTSRSMRAPVCSLQKSMLPLLRQLAEAGYASRIGVAEYRAYPTTIGQARGSNGLNYPYRRLRDLGTPDSELMSAINSLSGNGGSGAALAAMHFMATGLGGQVWSEPSPNDIPAGQGMTFSPHALNVVLNVTDTWFSTPDRDPDYPGPGFDETIASLRRVNVRQIGLWVPRGKEHPQQTGQPARPDDDLAPAFDGVADLQRVARGTGAVAGTRVDCKDDGRFDIDVGMPLTCVFRKDLSQVIGNYEPEVVHSIVAMIDALVEYHTLDIEILAGHAAVSELRFAPVRVDVTDDNTVHFKVAYTCPLTLTDDHHVVLQAKLDGVPMAVTDAEVTCRGNPIPRIITPPALVPPFSAIALPPVLPLPAPGSAPAPAPAPQPQPAPAQATNTQAQAAAVAQRQEQPQVAFVHAAHQVRDQLQFENAMVRLNPHRDPTLSAKMSLAAALLVAAWSWSTLTLVRRHARVSSGRSPQGGMLHRRR